jgi:hypothetical protein
MTASSAKIESGILSYNVANFANLSLVAKGKVIGKCALCGKRRVLQRSHLMPRRLYGMTRQHQGQGNANPVLVTQTITLQSSKQVWSHLLCAECEDRFSKGGEQYALSQVHNGTDFPLLDRMNVAMPVQTGPSVGVSLYSGTAMGIQADKLTYFALSIFWRGSAHRWSLPNGGAIWNSLGVYEPPIRDYLLGKGPYPPDLVLLVIACTDWQSQGNFYSPATVVGNQIPSLGLLTRGIHFRLFLTNNLPAYIKKLCFATSPRHFIAMGSCLNISADAFGHLMKTSRQAASLTKSMKKRH